MISNLLFFIVECDIGQITNYFSGVYSNEVLLELQISALDNYVKGSMCL
jgi:hypothetical protein